MSITPDSPAQTTESSDLPQVQSTPKPNFILFYFLLVFGLFWEVYLALFHFASYLERSLQYTQISHFIILWLGLEHVSLWSGGIMAFFAFFFLLIPTLRYICLLCFLRLVLYFFCTIEGACKKSYPLLRIIFLLWSIYYIGFFIYLVQKPFGTSFTWPMTPFVIRDLPWNSTPLISKEETVLFSQARESLTSGSSNRVGSRPQFFFSDLFSKDWTDVNCKDYVRYCKRLTQ